MITTLIQINGSKFGLGFRVMSPQYYHMLEMGQADHTVHSNYVNSRISFIYRKFTLVSQTGLKHEAIPVNQCHQYIHAINTVNLESLTKCDDQRIRQQANALRSRL